MLSHYLSPLSFCCLHVCVAPPWRSKVYINRVCCVDHSHVLLSDRQWNTLVDVYPCRNRTRWFCFSGNTRTSPATPRNYVNWHVTSYVGNVGRIRRCSRHLSAIFWSFHHQASCFFPCSGSARHSVTTMSLGSSLLNVRHLAVWHPKVFGQSI